MSRCPPMPPKQRWHLWEEAQVLDQIPHSLGIWVTAHTVTATILPVANSFCLFPCIITQMISEILPIPAFCPLGLWFLMERPSESWSTVASAFLALEEDFPWVSSFSLSVETPMLPSPSLIGRSEILKEKIFCRTCPRLKGHLNKNNRVSMNQKHEILGCLPLTSGRMLAASKGRSNFILTNSSHNLQVYALL